MNLANNSATILTVDDNEALRYSLVRTLTDAGFRVLEAKSGAEALELAAQLPDLITLDVNLPDMDGFEVCRRLKNSPDTAHIPILQISATFVDSHSRAQGLNGGADGYLAEPVDRNEILASVRALLRVKEAEREAIRQAREAEEARRELKQARDELEVRVRERTAELDRLQQSLRELTGRLLRMRDDEQRRLARDLHDSTGQLLTALSIDISFIEQETARLSPRAAKAARDANRLVQQALTEIRTVSHLLHPPLLDEAGLGSALAWYVQGVIERGDLTVELEMSAEIGRLPQEIETAIFRVVQESLMNVYRHSQSKTAQIRINRIGNEVRVEVTDQGKGISEDTLSRLDFPGSMGVGIRGMRERIRQLGGRLLIDSGAGGTEITAMLPIPNYVSSLADDGMEKTA